MARKVALAKPKMRPTQKMQKLVRAYFGAANFNKTKALKIAGYSDAKNAHGVFCHPWVQQEIERRQAANREKYDISYDRCMRELARVAFANVYDFAEIQKDGTLTFDFNEIDAETAAALGEVTVETFVEGRGDEAQEVKRIKVKPWNKLEALNQIMRHGGLSKERQPLDGAVDLMDRILAARNRAPNMGRQLEREELLQQREEAIDA